MAIILKFPTQQSFTSKVKTAKAPVPKRQRAATQNKEERKAMLAKIHIALNQLYKQLVGFTEDVYRYKLREDFGKNSAADLNNKELHQVLLWLASLGFTAKKGKHRAAAPKALTHDVTGLNREELLGKIEALLAEKGRVEGTEMPWGYAVSILKRQTANDPKGQVKSFDKATRAQLNGVIAALWQDAKRKKRRVR